MIREPPVDRARIGCVAPGGLVDFVLLAVQQATVRLSEIFPSGTDLNGYPAQEGGIDIIGTLIAPYQMSYPFKPSEWAGRASQIS